MPTEGPCRFGIAMTMSSHRRSCQRSTRRATSHHVRTADRATRTIDARPGVGPAGRLPCRPDVDGQRVESTSGAAAGWPAAPSCVDSSTRPAPASSPGSMSGQLDRAQPAPAAGPEHAGRVVEAGAAPRRPPPGRPASPARRSGRRRRRAGRAASGTARRGPATSSTQSTRASAMTRPGRANPPTTSALATPPMPACGSGRSGRRPGSTMATVITAVADPEAARC